MYFPCVSLPLVDCREPFAQEDIPPCYCARDQSPAYVLRDVSSHVHTCDTMNGNR